MQTIYMWKKLIHQDLKHRLFKCGENKYTRSQNKEYLTVEKINTPVKTQTLFFF